MTRIRAHSTTWRAPLSGLSALAGLLLGACSEPSAASDSAPDRQPLGKADNLGSCANGSDDHCGGPSDGTCWCDESCATYGDCCADKQLVCDGEGTTGGGASESSGGESGEDPCAGPYPVELVGVGRYATLPAAVTASTPGATIELCPGSYTGVKIEHDLTLRGSGQGVTFIEGGWNQRILTIDVATQVEVEALTIHGGLTGIMVGCAMFGCPSDVANTHLTVRDVTIQGGRTGIHGDGQATELELELDGVSIVDNENGLWLMRGQATLTDCMIEGNGEPDGGRAVTLYQSRVILEQGRVRRNRGQRGAVNLYQSRLDIDGVDFGAGAEQENTPYDVACGNTGVGWLYDDAHARCDSEYNGCCEAL